eukprot:CAMPEP_0117036264 /NCGR_PEP_ID=MMETSP0472-20121206/25698_1 /TAXON_ID=693140 ORGANISM="Tiarina fusus, Strain LIS" /NCGR_SAMPLE_ID=MMETSP0472 /ASSEMBLY_ACC=CAM_ASM_000603 /LENGTH=238 /DNA_ID=CAMNT_0004745967 /DNA_START=38 /DNA_END=754 /DNA_ORIENTATION=+
MRIRSIPTSFMVFVAATLLAADLPTASGNDSPSLGGAAGCSCDYGATEFIFVPAYLSWEDHLRRADELQCSLASIRSMSEQKAVEALLPRLPDNIDWGPGDFSMAYLGGVKIVGTNSPYEQQLPSYWAWMDGTPFNDTLNPNNRSHTQFIPPQRRNGADEERQLRVGGQYLSIFFGDADFYDGAQFGTWVHASSNSWSSVPRFASDPKPAIYRCCKVQQQAAFSSCPLVVDESEEDNS